MEYLPGLFLCVDDTPLHTQPLVAEFVYTGNTQTGDKVASCTFSPPAGTDEYTKLFLKCLKRPSHVPDCTISDVFSTADYVNRWKTRREKSSSSASDRHFRHYKVLHLLPEKYQDIFASMANIPYRTEYSVKRWQKLIDVLIMKKSEDFRVNRTRPIPLKEVDTNENAKRMAKDASLFAHQYNLLADE